MVNNLPGAPPSRKICPHISYSTGTVFCKGDICLAANPDRFKDEGFCFLVITDEPGEIPEKEDNDR